MYTFFIENNPFYKYQSSFLPHHPTVFQLINFFIIYVTLLITIYVLVVCSVMFQKLFIESGTRVFF